LDCGDSFTAFYWHKKKAAKESPQSKMTPQQQRVRYNQNRITGTPMGKRQRRTEGGQGGRLGRSRMDREARFGELKAQSRRARRINDRLATEEGLQLGRCGQPARPVMVKASWLTPAVLAIARRIDEDLAFDCLPILADALEEAACTDPEVLNHLRAPAGHELGCWVVDLLLRRG
jgi:hypothetical protein